VNEHSETEYKVGGGDDQTRIFILEDEFKIRQVRIV